MTLKVSEATESTMTLHGVDDITKKRFEFFVKWDGCVNIRFSEDEQIHVCGGVSQLIETLQELEVLAEKHFKGWPG